MKKTWGKSCRNNNPAYITKFWKHPWRPTWRHTVSEHLCSVVSVLTVLAKEISWITCKYSWCQCSLINSTSTQFVLLHRIHMFPSNLASCWKSLWKRALQGVRVTERESQPIAVFTAVHNGIYTFKAWDIGQPHAPANYPQNIAINLKFILPKEVQGHKTKCKKNYTFRIHPTADHIPENSVNAMVSKLALIMSWEAVMAMNFLAKGFASQTSQKVR